MTVVADLTNDAKDEKDAKGAKDAKYAKDANDAKDASAKASDSFICAPPHNPDRRLLSLHEIPAWMRDNDYVRTGYRPQQPTFRAALTTGLLTLTNDTLNIYTHFAGFVILLPLTLYLLGPGTRADAVLSLLPACFAAREAPSYDVLRMHGVAPVCHALPAPTATGPTTLEAVRQLLTAHRLALAPLLLSALCCLAFSAMYHTFWVLSPRVAVTLVKLDFVGIALLCVGHALTGIFYAFYCAPLVARRYYPPIVVSALILLPLMLSPRFATAAARPLRGIAFGLLGGLSLLPVVRAALRMSDWPDYVAVGGAVASLGAYAFGGFIYVSRFPECCRIGRHDRFLSSHQIMHCSVLLGVAAHLAACYYLLGYRVQYGCAVPP